MTNFNDTLLQQINKREMSASAFARMVGIKDSTFYDMLRSENITLKNALKVVDSLGTSLDYFEKKTKKFSYKFDKNYKVDLYSIVKKYLEDYNVSYLKLCRDIGISRANLTRWGQGGEPKYQTIVKLANYFKVSIDKFIGRV